MNCNQITTTPVCYTLGAVSRTILCHTTFGPDATGTLVPVATHFTEVDSAVVIDTSAGTVAAGLCPIVTGVVVPGISRFTGTTTAVGTPADVESLTLTVQSGIVAVNGNNIRPGSRSWGEGTVDRLDTTALVFIGQTPTTVFDLIWEV